MANRTFVTDSGGTARLLRRLAVVDSGGTTRFCKRVFVVDSGGTSRQVFRSELLIATMTEGTDTDGFTVAYGFDAGGYSGPFGAYGSMSSTTFPDGNTLLALYDLDTGFSGIIISSGSDPGVGYLTSVTVGATTKTQTGISYNYTAGQASWSWASTFGLDGSGTSAVTIT